MDVIAVIDVGSYNTRVLVAEQSMDGGINILGIGESRSAGVQRGNIINVEKASSSVIEALRDAENMAGVKVASLTASVGGESLRWVRSHGVVPIGGEEKLITRTDVQELLNSAKAIRIPADRQIIESFVKSYKVDSTTGIEDPIGMTGVRLEASVNIATLSKVNLDNLLRILENQRVEVNHFTLGIQGVAQSVVTEEEAELGIAVIDIGEGSTDIGVFSKKRIMCADVVRYAGGSITQDISVGLRIPVKQAHELKEKYGHCLHEKIAEDEIIEIPGIGGRKPRQISREFLVNIIQPRIEEILNMVNDKFLRGNMQNMLTAGIVITGGTALLPGIVQLAERVFNLPVRIGIPGEGTDMDGIIKTPIHAAALGAVLLTIEKESIPEHSGRKNDNVFSRMMKSIKKFWIEKKMK